MAAVEVTLPRRGRTTNLHGFSVQEDATPIDPGSSMGGVGTITVSVDDFPDAALMIGGVVLTDGSRGKTSGVVRDLTATDGQVTVTADSILGLFNAERTVPPFQGTFGQAVQFYCDLVEIPNDVVVHPSLSSRPVVFPGGRGNVWVKVKQMLAAENVEMALVFDRIYVRPLRQVKADLSRMSTHGWNLGSDTAARAIKVNYYNSVAGEQLEVYPRKDDENPQIIVVDSGRTEILEQQLNASLASVNQPVPQYNVANTTFGGTSGVYSITGVDDLPIQPAQWVAAGGSLTVELTDDPSVIRIIVQGADLPHLSPFRIAMSSGSSNYYNSLHITGTGVAWEKKTVEIRTGAAFADTSTEYGAEVDNPFIRTYGQALSVGQYAAAAYSGLKFSVNGTAFALNRTGENRDLIQATVADFSLAEVGSSVGDFNSVWAGNDIAAFNAYWQDQADTLWENQLFGNAPGARVLTDDANFRVTSATTNDIGVQFSADLDTTVEDFNPVWTGGTVASFNAQFSGYTCKDFSIVPLRRG